MCLFRKKKNYEIDKNKLPYHIAFIIDGNGRWAKQRGLPRSMGHKQGVVAVKDTIQNCYDLGIKQVSFFCFSTENWNRPKDEIDTLFQLLRDYISEDLLPYKQKGIKFIVSGDITKLPQDLQNAIENAVNETQSCDNMIVNMCINYGGRLDILRAVNNLLKQGKTEVTYKDFEQELYSKDLKEIDLVVRTSGEQRISNFMLYQMAYSELCFVKTYWPSFDKNELHKVLIDFASRNRRFGAIKE